MGGYTHYIRTDANGIVTHGFSDAFEQPQPGDLPLSGDNGRHFQIELANERGQYKYKVVDGQMVERTQAELDTEWEARPPAPKTELELLREENDALKQRATQNSADLQGFMDYYFSINPE